MANNNKSYRIKTNVGKETDTFLNVHLDQDYDSLEILSLKISDKDVYKLHNSDYGVIVGRVLANGNFGVPNAKISVFIPADEENSDLEMWSLYPYTSTSTKNNDDIRYNLLPDESVKDCHKAVGTFPNKTFLLENDATLEVFDKYYLYTTRTNAAGDYLICGVPTGTQTLHMDLDLSDCGILSQRPRDFVYKGYTIEQFENPNQFKKDENIDGLSQIFSQNQPVYVQPFWGNAENGEEIGITRADIEIAFKFEPTCVFMGSAISDNASNGVGKKCVPTNQMGAMDELTAGEGTIEMIRKTPGGSVEEFSIKGNQVINGNGVWCYQIPMNLDYMMTDEYGNMVPTDDPEKGIPTRTRVRFRASLTDMENSSQSFYRAKYLIPNNPDIDSEFVDYNFGTYTNEDSYRDLFWNGVYTVKSYIPRFQKSKRWKNERFSGIKACNYYGGNNPMPYNNLRIKIPFMFAVLCVFVKLFIKIVTIINRIQVSVFKMTGLINWNRARQVEKWGVHCTYIGDGLCPDMEGWYFAPACAKGIKSKKLRDALVKNTLIAAKGSGSAPGIEDKDSIDSTQYIDETSIDIQNTTTNEEESVCLTRDVDYLVNCFEMNLAEEYRVIKFDFYNDWVNGVLYFPRWMRKIKRKKRYKLSLRNSSGGFITTYYKDKVQGCMNSDNSNVKKTRYYTQQCSLAYAGSANKPWTKIETDIACNDKDKSNNTKVHIFPARCHKKKGMDQTGIFGKNLGLVTEQSTMLGEYVYYLKPCEWNDTNNGRRRALLFATDIVLLGTLNDCDENGIPQSFKYLSNTSYIMPTNLALTTMDDDSFIYSDNKGSVCYSSSELVNESNFNESKLIDSAKRVIPNYSGTSRAYEKTEDDKIDYEENDDPIPVTEAAGIMWNYSGPGQENVAADKLESPTELVNRIFGSGNKYRYIYYPGGHFLGLTCVNSETNIKSCVNLKRICELGATMSQRREELRGYDEVKGTPKYMYYVPTGLISNVDIEGASFRSMFATLNHNKLIATKLDEKTGYNRYDFRFLSPDGFDGSLKTYVHKTGSPYNRKINDGSGDPALVDNTAFFLAKFLSWEKPLDYDPQETAFTETRTVEDTVDDYYMFRFGVNDFTTKEQKKHYLKKARKGYSLPQYENSFYFYFGLKDGSTALDEFKKQFFSECEANNVMKSPSIAIVEKIEDDLSGTATLVINNMFGPYSVTLIDNTVGEPEVTINPTNDDTIDLEVYEASGISIVIGHEYTVTVKDSIGQEETKTFVFGSDAIIADIDVVHFRYNRSTNSRIDDPKFGGYLMIGDEIKILGETHNISTGEISFKYKRVGSSALMNLVQDGSYVDASDEKWYIFPIDNIGAYEFYANFNDKNVIILSTTVEDNSNVELSVGCDYFGYKTGKSLGTIPERNWYNTSTLFGGNTEDAWLFRHTLYRQTEDDSTGFDLGVYTNTKGGNMAVFGWPERGGLTNDGEVSANTYYKDDYESYEDYSIEENWSFIPTMYWNPSSHQMEPDVTGRNPFDIMVYTDDGRAAASATNIVVTEITTGANDSLLITCTGSSVNVNGISGISEGHGFLIVLENEQVLPAIATAITQNQIKAVCYNTENPYGNINTNTQEGQTQLEEILKLATVYPTLRVPVIYKPFYAEISAATWNITGLTLEMDEDGASVIRKVKLPLSYKVEGVLHNGLTWNSRFYSGDTASQGEEQTYATYFVDDTNSGFCSALSSVTSEDYKYDRQMPFGTGSLNAGFTREITDYNSEAEEDTDELTYAITEGYPNIDSVTKPGCYTGRYANGFDLAVLEDSFPLSEVFPDNLRIYANTISGAVSACCLVADSLPDQNLTELYIVKYTNSDSDLFMDDGPYQIEVFGADYVYGTYNFNAQYDVKGAATTGREASGIFTFVVTKSNGTKKRIINNEVNSFEKGVTVFHKYTLNSQYRQNLSLIERNILSNQNANVTRISATTLENGVPIGVGINIGSQPPQPPQDNTTYYTNFDKGICQYFPGSRNSVGTENYTAIIAKYVRESTETKNKMTLYKLYPVKGLDIMYPPNSGDIDEDND